MAPSVDSAPRRPGDFCLHDLLQYRARRTPNAPALLAPGRASLPYARLQAQLDATVLKLNALGVGRGDRVALVLPNASEMAVALLAVASTATAAPLNPASGAEDFEVHLASVKAKAVIVQAGVPSPVREVAKARGLAVIELLPIRNAEAGVFSLRGDEVAAPAPPCRARVTDIALVLRTTGKTSAPKLVPLTHANLCAAAFNIGSILQLLENDRCLNVMPLFHVHGIVAGLVSSLVAGASLACLPDFSARAFFGWLGEVHPTWFTATPMMHQSILERASANSTIISCSPLRFIRSSDGPLPRTVMAALEKTFLAPVVEAYGMTEAAHQVASNPLPPRPRQPGSAGFAAGPEIAIIGEAGVTVERGCLGEIVIRGEAVTSGYENSPAADVNAFTDGWFHTGDLGHLDAEGRLFVDGRIAEMIQHGGKRIVSHEIGLETGGDSMFATQLISRVCRRTAAEVSPVARFENPTIAGLTQAIPRRQAGKAQSSEQR